MTVTISVVIPARNESSRIGTSVRALLDQEPPPHEVIVVDDASTDDTREVAQAAGARVVRLEERSWAAAARNAGVSTATGSVLAFVDADDFVDPGWSRAISEAFETGADIVAGAIVPQAPAGAAQRFAGEAALTHDLEARGGFLPSASSANLAVRRSVFDALNGFDATIRSGHDTDFSWRACLAGYTIIYAPDARVRYRLRSSYVGLLRQMAFRSFWHADIARKYDKFVFRAIWRRADPRRIWFEVLKGVAFMITPRVRPRWPAARDAWMTAGVLAVMRTSVRFGRLHSRMGRRPLPDVLQPATDDARYTASALNPTPRALVVGPSSIVRIVARGLQAHPVVAATPPGIAHTLVDRWQSEPPTASQLVKAARAKGWRFQADLATIRLQREQPRTSGDAYLLLHAINAWLQGKKDFVLVEEPGGGLAIAARLAEVPLIAVDVADGLPRAPLLALSTDDVLDRPYETATKITDAIGLPPNPMVGSGMRMASLVRPSPRLGRALGMRPR